jgi:hypothetical protein
VERTLPNTFALFRKMITLDALPKSAHGWITADSRYRLTVNGRHVQWGIAPSDPRTPDVDLVDLAPYLQKGQNAVQLASSMNAPPWTPPRGSRATCRVSNG